MPTESNTVTGQRMVVLDDGRNVPVVALDGTVGLPGYDADFDKLVVGTTRDKFRDEFFSFDTVSVWELVQTGSGMTIAPQGASFGSRYLAVATGTDANSETIILSRRSFRMPFKLGFGLTMSQRIANQEVVVELVSVNAAGQVETDATFASPAFANALNGMAFRFDGTTPTSVTALHRGFGVTAGSVSMTSQATTVGVGSGAADLMPAGVYEIHADMESLYFQSMAMDALTAPNTPAVRQNSLPDPAKLYKLRVRIRNLSTAPASSTDVGLHFVRLLDTARMTVDFRQAGRPTDIRSAVPVLVAGGQAVTVQGMTASGSTQTGNVVPAGVLAKTTQPSTRNDNAATGLVSDKLGRPVVVLGHIRELVDTNAAVTLSGTTETTIVSAAASTFNDLHALEASNTSTTGVRVDVRDSVAGTVRLSFWLAGGSSAVFEWSVPKKQASANAAWTAQLSAVPTGGDVRISSTTVRNI
ncbi:hypothetical protein [Prosthecomicrobium sp. N25]|uniref:hypothetical protein n=1 Tax=Prosthecomicrobium sp. N25 TaxID=3129254 RepID=UPI003076FC7A